MKKYALTALVASACMAFSSVGYGAVFSDVGSNLKWAESYINSVYENGLMVGDYNSAGARVFRGTENITYSETAQLIYTMALKSGFTTDVTELGINRYSMEMSNEGIDQWAEKAVAFCMEKGIVSSYDLTKFKNNGQNAYISREDLTALFGKTLALSYTVSTGTSLSFNDTWNISQAARPYVELMNKMGVVTGDENNNFNPKANITRAETAVIASKAYDVMRQKNIANPESGYTQTTGTVVSVYDRRRRCRIRAYGRYSRIQQCQQRCWPYRNGTGRHRNGIFQRGFRGKGSYYQRHCQRPRKRKYAGVYEHI